MVGRPLVSPQGVPAAPLPDPDKAGLANALPGPLDGPPTPMRMTSPWGLSALSFRLKRAQSLLTWRCSPAAKRNVAAPMLAATEDAIHEQAVLVEVLELHPTHLTVSELLRRMGVDPAGAFDQVGTCAHPVTGGTGDFAGATGFLMMVDTPIKKAPFVKTEYEGIITLSGPSLRGSTERRAVALLT